MIEFISEILPLVMLGQVRLVGFDTASNSFSFSFDLMCTQVLTDSANANAACNGQLLSQFEYLLIEDTYGSKGPCIGNASKKCDKFFDGSQQQVTVPDDIIAPFGAVNGGFKTATLPAHAQYYINPQSVLLVRVAGSYAYFQIAMNPTTGTSGNGGKGKGKGPNK